MLIDEELGKALEDDGRVRDALKMGEALVREMLNGPAQVRP